MYGSTQKVWCVKIKSLAALLWHRGFGLTAVTQDVLFELLQMRLPFPQRQQQKRYTYSTGKGFYKTDYYALFPPAENPNIFTEINEEKHGVKRRMASNAYSLKSVLDFERLVDKTEICFFQRLDDLFVRGDENVEEDCDLGAWLQYYAFDVRLLPYRVYAFSDVFLTANSFSL
jgi:hypothetical protein